MSKSIYRWQDEIKPIEFMSKSSKLIDMNTVRRDPRFSNKKGYVATTFKKNTYLYNVGEIPYTYDKEFTICFWAKFERLKDVDEVHPNSIHIIFNDGTSIGTTLPKTIGTDNKELVQTDWNWYKIQRDENNTVTIYVNNEQIATGTNTTVFNLNDKSYIYLGNDSKTLTGYDVTVDDILIFGGVNEYLKDIPTDYLELSKFYKMVYIKVADNSVWAMRSEKTALDETVPMYGVLFKPNSTMGTRTYDAAGLTWNRSSNTVEGIDNFKNIAPFKTRECCRIWDDAQKKATYVYKDDYTETEWETIRKGTHASIKGDIMIEVSEFWYRRVQRTDKKFEIIVAPKYKAGFKPDPWHYVNGKHYEKRYISKYKLSGDFNSLSGQTPRTDTALNTARTSLKAKGMNELTFQAQYSLVMLMLVKYATTDVQAVVANGYSEGQHVWATGGADNVKGTDGSATVVSANESALALGIEDFWGNVCTYIDGAVCYAGKVYFKDVDTIQTDPSNANELTSWTATTSTYPNGGNDTLITAIANDADYDWLFTPSADANATTQTVNDNYWSAYGLQAPFVGGGTWDGSLCGLFAFLCAHAVGTVSVAFGFCAIA